MPPSFAVPPELQLEIEQLAVEVGALLKRTRVKLATAESCTGGWIAEARELLLPGKTAYAASLAA